MRLASLITLALLVLSPASASRADVKVCNDFRAAISLAIAYEDKGSFASEGWWKVEPSACRDLAFGGIDFHYTAESAKYRDGGSQKQNMWGKGRRFQVGTGTFKLEDAERSRRGTRPREFSKVTVDQPYRGQPAVTLRFRDGTTTVEVTRK